MLSDLFLEAGKLKEIERTGWIRSGIPKPESVADHSWRTALMAMLLCPDGLDREKAIMMALVHDLGEVDAGDITPADKVLAKDEIERHCIARLSSLLPGEKASQLKELWEEFASHKTPLARFVKECDVLDMGLQAKEYEGRYKDVIHGDWPFVQHARERLSQDMRMILDAEDKI